MNITLESREDWQERVTKWHRHYALLPREVADGEWRWLCYIEARLVHTGRWPSSFWRMQFRDPDFSMIGWPKLAPFSDGLPPPSMPKVKAARHPSPTCTCRSNTCAGVDRVV